MENPTGQAEASIPTETVIAVDDTVAYLNYTFTFTVRRKAAKRTEPWYLEPPVPVPQNVAAALPPSPQAEVMPIRKKRRIEEPPHSTSTTDEADGTVDHPADDDVDVDADPVTDTQSNPSATKAAGRWTLEEDVKLTSTVAKIKEKWCGKDYKIDWVAVAALVPDRTNIQCRNRWCNLLYPGIAVTAGRTVKWTEGEDLKLRHAVQMHGDKDWAAISALVPGRTAKQCTNRWRNALHPSIALTAGHMGKWSEDEDLKLKHSVRMHGGKDWAAIAALVPGRTGKQCRNRWCNVLMLGPAGRTVKWTKDEDLKLKHSVQMHGGKDWAAITALLTGRTIRECRNRWHSALHPIIALTARRTGKWTEDEDLKLKNAVETHGDNDWVAAAALVPSRTKVQCRSRWCKVLSPSIAVTAGRTGKWTEDEDLKLRHAVQMYGGKEWAKISTLLPGRTMCQCYRRWHGVLNPLIAPTAGRTANWTRDEDFKLMDAVQIHGGKDWVAIAELVPGRTNIQCSQRWRAIKGKEVEDNAASMDSPLH